MGYQHMVVIFLDILGSGEIKNFEKKYEIHNLFHNEVRSNENRQKNLDHVVYNRKIYSFSDCAYIFYYYKDGIEEHRKNDENLIFIATSNTCLSILKFLNRGYFIRGGISFGEAYFDDLGFFGPAVEKAYEIESKFACYPRVMFDHITGKRVFEWEHNMENKDPTLLALYRKTPFLTEIESGSYFANIFYNLEKNGYLSFEDCNLSLEEIKRVVMCKVATEKELHKNNPRILEKLEWIQKYTRSKKLLLDESKASSILNFVPNN